MFLLTSGLIRGHEKAKEEFFKLNGMTHLMEAMSTNHEKIIIKSCFLLSSLVNESKHCQGKNILNFFLSRWWFEFNTHALRFFLEAIFTKLWVQLN